VTEGVEFVEDRFEILGVSSAQKKWKATSHKSEVHQLHQKKRKIKLAIIYMVPQTWQLQ